MKRGLVVLDHAEIPEQEWRRRIDAVRQELRAQGVDIALVYGDVFRSDDIAYLTNLCIYWNEGMLAVPADGDPALLTKLSPRVHTWMRRTSTLTDLRSGRDFGSLVGALLADRPAGTLGLVDAGLWPSALVDEVTNAAADWTVRPLEGLVRQLRVRPSEPEVALLRQASATLTAALADASRGGLSDQERISVCEQAVRAAGFTDVLVRASAASVEITGQYRNSWLRVGRDLTGRLSAALAAAVAAAKDAAPAATLADAAAQELTGLPTGAVWQVRVVDHADLSTNGEYAGQSADRRLAAGEVVVISVEVIMPDGPALAASDTVLIGAHGAESLTGGEVARR